MRVRGAGGSSSFTVYGQTNNTGKLTADGSGRLAGIRARENQKLIVNGGSVVARASGGSGAEEVQGAGIGGSGESNSFYDCGTVEINGGTVSATADGDAAGIGGAGHARAGKGGTVTIRGGSVTARSLGLGAGIGSGASPGSSAGSGGTVKISNAVVTAISENGGPGIGGSLGTKLELGNNAVVMAGGMYRGISVDTLTKSNCILIGNHKGELCGAVRLPGNVATRPNIASRGLIGEVSMEIPEDGELVIPNGATLDNEDWAIVNRGKVTVEFGGTLKLSNGDGKLDNTQGEFVNNGSVEGTPPGSGISRTHVTAVSLSMDTLALKSGKSATLTCTVSPPNPTNPKVSWQSDCPRVASVDANGTVTAHSAGTANITVTPEDGGKTATCTVTVTDAATRPPDPSGVQAELDKANAARSKAEQERDEAPAALRKGGRAVIAWKAPKGVGGLSWQVRYRQAGSSKWTVKKSSKAKLSVKGLKAGKVYVFKARGYKKVAGKTVRTAWTPSVRAHARR